MLNFTTSSYLYPPSASPSALFPQSFRFQPSFAEISKLLNSPSAELPCLEQCPKCNAYLTADLITKNSLLCVICCENLKGIKNIKVLMNDAKGLKTKENEKSYFYVKKSIPIKKIEKCIVVCLDMSGSMNLTYLVDGKNKSRFVILIEELYQQLVEMNQSEENVRLFLIGFNDSVKLYGDLISEDEPMVLEGDILDSISKIKEKSKAASSSLCLRVLSESLKEMKNLIDRMPETIEEEMEEDSNFKCEGRTALGPAIAAALGVIEGLNLNKNEVLILTDGMANAHVGNIENWLNEKMDYEIKTLIDAAKEKGEVHLKDEPKITFYQEMAKLGNDLKTIFYFFGFQDQEIIVAVLFGLIYKSKNGSFFKIPISNEDPKDPKIASASLERFRNKLKKALSMSKVIGYDGTLSVFTRNPIAIDANIQRLAEIPEQKVANSINKNSIKMEIICNQNSINLFYHYFERNKTPLFFHSEFKFFKYLKNEIQEIILVFEVSIKPYLDTTFYQTGLKLDVVRDIFLESDLTKRRDLLSDFLVLNYKVCHYENADTKPINDFLKDLRYQKSISFKEDELKKLIEKAKSQKMKEEEKLNEILEDEKTRTKYKKKSCIYVEESKEESKEKTKLKEKPFLISEEPEEKTVKQEKKLNKLKEKENLSAEKNRYQIQVRKPDEKDYEIINESEDELTIKRKKKYQLVVEEKQLFDMKEIDISIRSSDKDEDAIAMKRRGIRKRV